LIDELSKWKVVEMEKKITSAKSLPVIISREQTKQALWEYMEIIRYDEHAKTCEICSLRKDINDKAPGYCKRWKELQ
jgi:hypothetical protein